MPFNREITEKYLKYASIHRDLVLLYSLIIKLLSSLIVSLFQGEDT